MGLLPQPLSPMGNVTSSCTSRTWNHTTPAWVSWEHHKSLEKNRKNTTGSNVTKSQEKHQTTGSGVTKTKICAWSNILEVPAHVDSSGALAACATYAYNAL